MDTVIGEIFEASDAVSYVEHHLRGVGEMPPSERQRQAFAIAAARLVEPARMPVEFAETMPRHSAPHRQYLERLLARLPLAEGETIAVPDALGVLTAEYAAVPAHTIVMRRTTNRGILYYLFRGATFDRGVIHLSRPSRRAPRAVPSLPGTVIPIWATLALELAKGVAGGIGDKIGAQIFDLVYGKVDMPPWFAEAYRQFSAMVYQALNEQWMREMQASMLSTSSKLKQYISSGDLFMLENAWGAATDLVGSLLTYGYTSAANFVNGAGLHLLTLQELALKSKKPDGYRKLIKELAQSYGPWALAAVEKLVADRLAKIGAVYLKNIGSGKEPIFIYRFEDAATGYHDGVFSECSKDAKAEATALRNQYVTRVDTAIREELKPIVDVTGEWKKLETRPIPTLLAASA